MTHGSAASAGSLSRAPSTAGRLVVIRQHPDTKAYEPLGFLGYDGVAYSFCYIERVREVRGFRPLIGFPDITIRYESPTLFPLFIQRVMDPRRPDYPRYVRRLALSHEATPWEQIARSEGRRSGDTLQLFPEPRVDSGHFDCVILVHGIRHVFEGGINLGGRHYELAREDLEQSLEALQAGERLSLRQEANNPVNPRALMVCNGAGSPLGWLPDLLVEDIHRLREVSEVMATVVRVNDNQTPWHMRLLVRLSGGVPDGFRFFAGSEWQPICD